MTSPETQLDSSTGASSEAPVHAHGLEQVEGAKLLHFGMALWPYDVLLRFGYDLPENEHMWTGEWFDDRYEAAALDLRSTAAKLVLAIGEMHEAVTRLADVAASEAKKPDIAALKGEVERAPLSLDLVLGYLRRIQDDIAVLLPNVYGQHGQSVSAARGSLTALAALGEVETLDPALGQLARSAPSLDIRTNRLDLYVIGDNALFGSALPKAAMRALRSSAAVTLSAAEELRAIIASQCAWLDDVLAHVQRVVAEHAEDGPDLLERWAERDWSVLATLKAPNPALEYYLPAL